MDRALTHSHTSVDLQDEAILECALPAAWFGVYFAYYFAYFKASSAALHADSGPVIQ